MLLDQLDAASTGSARISMRSSPQSAGGWLHQGPIPAVRVQGEIRLRVTSDGAATVLKPDQPQR